MGVRVVLDIVPRCIDPEAWAEAYDEAHRLLMAHPARLLGYDWSTVAGVPLPVYTRAVERDRDDPSARRWCVAGERATLTTGEPQTMYRDLGRYLAPASTPHGVPSPAPDDILAVALDTPTESEPIGRALPAHPVPSPGCAPHVGHASAHPGGGRARVLGDATCGASYRLPLLAAAMVIEARFPRHAMVHGDVDREQAEAARRWAEGVLGRPIALPVRVEAWRLVERLGAHFEGQALRTAVERLHIGSPERRDAALLTTLARADGEPWWLGKLGEHAHLTTAGAQQLLAAYLDATGDLGRLCGLACLDARGPRYAPEALMAALATLRARPGGLTRLDDTSVEQALTLVFGAGAARLLEVLRRGDGVPDAPESHAPTEPSLAAELGALATLPSAGDLTPLQRDHVHALALAAGSPSTSAPTHERAEASSPEAALRTLATLMARSGPTLTEDAWDWITREEDVTLVRFLVELAALDDPSAALGLVRRALFENRNLCRYALGALQAADADTTGAPGAAAPSVVPQDAPLETEPEGRR